MTTVETELEMATRHVAEQEERIGRQEILIERFRNAEAPADDALKLLDTMRTLLETMHVHVARVSN